MQYSKKFKRSLVNMREIMLFSNIWQFCKEYPGWAATLFFCGWLIGATVKYSMNSI